MGDVDGVGDGGREETIRALGEIRTRLDSIEATSALSRRPADELAEAISHIDNAVELESGRGDPVAADRLRAIGEPSGHVRSDHRGWLREVVARSVEATRRRSTRTDADD